MILKVHTPVQVKFEDYFSRVCVCVRCIIWSYHHSEDSHL